MRILRKLSQHRRDFRAVFVCEHCEAEYELPGYDDKNFHDNVIPTIPCRVCGKKSPDTYWAEEPLFPEGYQI